MSPPCRAIRYDGHTLARVLSGIEQQNGAALSRVLTDADIAATTHRPHGAAVSSPSAQRRGVTPTIKRALRRHAAVERVSGNLKDDHRMGRNYLAGRAGDAINAVMAAVGYNFRRLLAWLAALLCLLLGGWLLITNGPRKLGAVG